MSVQARWISHKKDNCKLGGPTSYQVFFHKKALIAITMPEKKIFLRTCFEDQYF